MRVLMHLVEHAGRVVSVRELLDTVWKDVVVTQDSVYTSIADLRRALGDDGEAHRVIVNVPRRGYRLVTPVRRPAPAAAATELRQPPDPQPVRAETARAESPPVPATAAPEPGAVRVRRTARGRVPLAVAGALVLALVASVAWWQRVHGSLRPSAPPDLSVAVLPCSDLSGQQDQQYFADGLAVEILDELQHIPGLKVIGRESSFQFRGAAQDPRRIGTALDAAYLLEGRGRRSGDRVRVSAQLVATRDGAPRWSKTYEVTTPDVFKIQDTVAADLARYLKLTVADVEPQRNKMAPEAYDLYLHAIQLLDSLSQENTVRAVATLEEAERLEPKSAKLQSALAIGHGAMLFQGWAPAAEAFAASKRHAQLALKLDPSNGTAHAALGAVTAAYEWDWTAAQAEMDQAIRLAPSDPWVLFLGASVYSINGDWRRARKLSEELLAIDPLSHLAEFALGAKVLMRQGDYVGAEKHLRRAIQIRPEYQTLRYYLAQTLLGLGRAADALEESGNLDPAEGRDSIAAMALYSLNRPAEAQAALARARTELKDGWPYAIASVYAYRGQADEAIEWLDRTYRARGMDIYMMKGDPAFVGLVKDPRYRAFLQKMNLPL